MYHKHRHFIVSNHNLDWEGGSECHVKPSLSDNVYMVFFMLSVSSFSFWIVHLHFSCSLCTSLIFVCPFAGKKPRDLLNPKAIKYMQSIFSIKDSISKKETREISALCGVTITQVVVSPLNYFFF